MQGSTLIFCSFKISLYLISSTTAAEEKDDPTLLERWKRELVYPCAKLRPLLKTKTINFNEKRVLLGSSG